MGKRYALIIGNSDYTDSSLSRLKAPDVDVSSLHEVLAQPQIGNFDDVSMLVNESVTTIRRAVAQLYARKERDDLLLLYFSGHGVLDDSGRLYLAVRDTEREWLRATALPSSFIAEEMDRSRSQRQVLILDCCHSGAFARGTKGMLGASVGTAAAFEGSGFGRVVLTASDATQFAWEGDQVIGNATNSLFTHFLVEGLKTGKADIDEDGLVTLEELYDFLYANVLHETPDQTPGKWSYKQQGDIVLARSPNRKIQLPRELMQAVESPLAGVREGAIADLAKILVSSHESFSLAAREALLKLTQDDSRRVSLAAEAALQQAESSLPQVSQTLAGSREAEEKIPHELFETVGLDDWQILTDLEQTPLEAEASSTAVVSDPVETQVEEDWLSPDVGESNRLEATAAPLPAEGTLPAEEALPASTLSSRVSNLQTQQSTIAPGYDRPGQNAPGQNAPGQIRPAMLTFGSVASCLAALVALVLVGSACFFGYRYLAGNLATRGTTQSSGAGNPIPQGTEGEAEAAQIPQASALVLAALEQAEQSWPVYLSEPYNNNINNWSEADVLDSYANIKWALVNGKYLVDATAKTNFIGWSAPRMKDVRDFYLQTEFQQTAGPEDAYAAIIFYLSQDVNGQYYYYFSLNQDGQARLDFWDGKAWNGIFTLDMPTSYEPGQVNRLEVLSLDQRYAFFLNDEFLGEVEHQGLEAGVVGVSIGIPSNGASAKFEWDNLVIKVPVLP